MTRCYSTGLGRFGGSKFIECIIEELTAPDKELVAVIH
jgi:hypothetical protein